MRRFLLPFALLALLLSPGCGDSSPGTTPLLQGYGLSPQGFPLDYSKLAEFFAEAGTLPNGAVMWNGAWRDDAASGTDAGTVPAAAQAIFDNATANDYTPIAVFGWRSGTTLYLNVPANATNDWTNTDARTAFQTMLTNFVTTNHPSFVFLGNENDFYYEQSPTDYANWLVFYDSAYDAIKASSPSTQVGPVFNVEHLSGAGALNGWTTPLWNAVDDHDFSRVDVVGLTVYPFFAHATAAAVPATYLDAVIGHLHGKPFAITETGWPAENLGALNPVWETSSQAQVNYLTQLGAMLKGKTLGFVNWLFLHAEADPGGSPDAWKIFGSISVRDGSGAERSVYGPWRTFQP